MASIRLETAKKFISYFAALDTDILESVLAETVLIHYAPASIPSPGPFGKQAMIEFVKKLKPIMASFPMTAKKYIESESGNQVVVWATSQAIFHDNVMDDGIAQDDWKYTGEYVMMITMDESGGKIVEILEFVDSLSVAKLVELSQRATLNLQKRQSSE